MATSRLCPWRVKKNAEDESDEICCHLPLNKFEPSASLGQGAGIPRPAVPPDPMPTYAAAFAGCAVRFTPLPISKFTVEEFKQMFFFWLFGCRACTF